MDPNQRNVSITLIIAAAAVIIVFLIGAMMNDYHQRVLKTEFERIKAGLPAEHSNNIEKHSTHTFEFGRKKD